MDFRHVCYFYGGVLLRGIVLCDGKGMVMHAKFVDGYRRLRYVEFR